MLQRCARISTSVAVALGLACGEVSPFPADELALADAHPRPSDPAALLPPTLEPPPAHYGYPTLPVRGSALPEQLVVILGGAEPAAVDAYRDSGSDFCVDVALAAGGNRLEIFTQDAWGNSSAANIFEVNYDAALAVWVTPPQPRVNATHGLAVASEQTPKEGVLSALTDDSTATHVLLPQAYVWVDLGEAYQLDTLELFFPAQAGAGDDTFATEYRILVSALARPSVPPSESNATWSVIYDVYPGSGLYAGNGGLDQFVRASPVTARHLAVHLIENNKTDWFSSEDLRTAELRAFGRAAAPLPAVQAVPTCANGGTP